MDAFECCYENTLPPETMTYTIGSQLDLFISIISFVLEDKLWNCTVRNLPAMADNSKHVNFTSTFIVAALWPFAVSNATT